MTLAQCSAASTKIVGMAQAHLDKLFNGQLFRKVK